MQVLNVFETELQEGPGRDGFWFRASPLRPALGGARIGAGLYEARAGTPIWPYHYHYPQDEWLYVLDGRPLLRYAGDRRQLAPHDLVRFPPGPDGAHTVEGPGRFLIFSGERRHGPQVGVYPDSDKISVFPGIEGSELNTLLFVRSAAVDYWHAEGQGQVPPSRVVREPSAAPPPAVSLDEVALEDGDGWRFGTTDAVLGRGGLAAAVLELDPSADFARYRYDHGRELWLLTLDGTPSVQHSQGERQLRPGDLACLPDGPSGGRKLINKSGSAARLLLLWTTGFPHASCYPDSGEWVLRTSHDAEPISLRHN